ncbi:cAMP-binding protein [Hyella patelloides LEGE 07179]|uniref:cAMP-binding protein n=1 Tax=Hyella patelloides LEGE 07179 TaxID=945734 RepID=A0A563VJV5_9CYAN|nr:Crp/Fnr family transcriptional regulator [Hyella patelloides]VEP11708.1 cAMP-binding protein [Hyella patelloides LEGE 07179]
MYQSFFVYIQQLSPELKFDTKLIEPLLKSQKLSKGEFIFHRDDICKSVYFTLQGCLRSFVIKNSKEYTLFFHLENHTFGDYESFQKCTPACFSCQAIENSEILIFNNRAMDFFENAPHGQKLLRAIAEDLAFLLRDKLLSLFLDTPEERYLKLLKTEPELLRRISQYYLASYLGIEPESLSRLKRRVYQQKNS